MYVCMYVWPCRARKYDQNGPSIHTCTARCRFEKGLISRVCSLLPMQAEEIDLREPILSSMHGQTYIHTSRHKYFHFVNCVLRYHFGQKTWPWPWKWKCPNSRILKCMYRFPRQAWANIHGILVLRW